MRKPRMIFGILALSLASTSCWRQKAQARIFTPPPVRPEAVPPDSQEVLPDPPQIDADSASAAPPALVDMMPEIALAVPVAPKPAVRRQAPVAPPKPAVAGPAVPEPVAPKLAPMYTPTELRQYTQSLNDSLERVNRALAIVEGKNLTPDQKEIAERIRTFRKQAEQAREQDLLTAVSLARRADLLAKDLLERLP